MFVVTYSMHVTRIFTVLCEAHPCPPWKQLLPSYANDLPPRPRAIYPNILKGAGPRARTAAGVGSGSGPGTEPGIGIEVGARARVEAGGRFGTWAGAKAGARSS